jgi:hypothetical protein
MFSHDFISNKNKKSGTKPNNVPYKQQRHSKVKRKHNVGRKYGQKTKAFRSGTWLVVANTK